MKTCPTCGQEIKDQNLIALDEDGFPQIGQTWYVPERDIDTKDGGKLHFPEATLHITEIHKRDRLGREIRGQRICKQGWKKNEGPYATSLAIFNAIFLKDGHIVPEETAEPKDQHDKLKGTTPEREREIQKAQSPGKEEKTKS